MFLLLAFLIPFSWATCNNVDLNSSTVLRDIPILDQDGTQLCASMVAAQLLEFKLRTNNINFSPSAVDLALQNSVGTGFMGADTNPYAFNSIRNSIGGGISHGVVSRQCVEEQIRTYSRCNNITSAQYFQLLEEARKADSLLRNDTEDSARLGRRLQGNANFVGCRPEVLSANLARQGIFGEPITKILNPIINPCSTQRRTIRNYPVTTLDAKSGASVQQMFTLLDQQLNGRKPAGLMACGESFNPQMNFPNLPNLPSSNRDSITTPSDYKNICSNHAVVISGRRTNGNACEYLVRNSIGANWNPRGAVCACKSRTGRYFPECRTLESEVRAGRMAQTELSGRTYVGCWIPMGKISQGLNTVSVMP